MEEAASYLEGWTVCFPKDLEKYTLQVGLGMRLVLQIAVLFFLPPVTFAFVVELLHL